jgi:hypothetical protein
VKEEILSQKFMEAVKGVVPAIRESTVGQLLGKAVDLVQSSPTLNDMANHGRTELAAALNHGADAYVMYQKGSHDQPSPEVQKPEMTQSKGISM